MYVSYMQTTACCTMDSCVQMLAYQGCGWVHCGLQLEELTRLLCSQEAQAHPFSDELGCLISMRQTPRCDANCLISRLDMLCTCSQVLGFCSMLLALNKASWLRIASVQYGRRFHVRQKQSRMFECAARPSLHSMNADIVYALHTSYSDQLTLITTYKNSYPFCQVNKRSMPKLIG